MDMRQIPDGATADLTMDIPASRDSSGVHGLVEALYQEHYDALYRYLVLTGSSASDADEFTQEAFLRLLRTLQGRGGIRNARHWLFRVVHNLRADWRRESGRQSGHAAETELYGGTPDPRPDPEAELLLAERPERLRAALAQLTERQSEILHLRAEGLKLREVAELLDISLQSVSEVCARAMDRVGRLVNE
jgi:RNA polymerase sigma factor (sigma-70 family)